MIRKLTFATVYVLNQASAYDFYVNKLGFKVHTDAPLGNDNRWLTVTPPDQPEIEISLLLVAENEMFTKEAVKAVTELIKKGTFGHGGFECNDIYATYEELKSKGVEFAKPPKEESYGVAAVFKDDSGNWFSLTQKG
ncbi:VOC family protein [Pedobacter nutrimenti]|uniref:VOC family protein n=1 Tax=Pedobacter nutrimenti TaxID=1241337 RepID=UPI0029312B4F|nr:VOC family protein [Pedobacter nutrimenti]